MVASPFPVVSDKDPVTDRHHDLASKAPPVTPVESDTGVRPSTTVSAPLRRLPRKQNRIGPYLLMQTLGEGEFGKVKLGLHLETGQEVAVKLIKKESVGSMPRMNKVEREVGVLKILKHPHIVKLFDVVETDRYIGIILEYASGGELFEYILAHRFLKEKDARRLFAQLVSSVQYMHEKNVVHRDLKLENILLDRHRNVIVTDFGFANQFDSATNDLMATSCGSPCYAAPELVVNDGLYAGSAVDVWSCGVILYAMLCGYLPYDDDPTNPGGDNINLLYRYILSTTLVFPRHISREARDLIQKMLTPDPTKRCKLEHIMEHPWLAEHQALFERHIKGLAVDGTTDTTSCVGVGMDSTVCAGAGTVCSRFKEIEDEHIREFKDRYAPLENEAYNPEKFSRSEGGGMSSSKTTSVLPTQGHGSRPDRPATIYGTVAFRPTAARPSLSSKTGKDTVEKKYPFATLMKSGSSATSTLKRLKGAKADKWRQFFAGKQPPLPTAANTSADDLQENALMNESDFVQSRCTVADVGSADNSTMDCSGPVTPPVGNESTLSCETNTGESAVSARWRAVFHPGSRSTNTSSVRERRQSHVYGSIREYIAGRSNSPGPSSNAESSGTQYHRSSVLPYSDRDEASIPSRGSGLEPKQNAMSSLGISSGRKAMAALRLSLSRKHRHEQPKDGSEEGDELPKQSKHGWPSLKMKGNMTGRDTWGPSTAAAALAWSKPKSSDKKPKHGKKKVFEWIKRKSNERKQSKTDKSSTELEKEKSTPIAPPLSSPKQSARTIGGFAGLSRYLESPDEKDHKLRVHRGAVDRTALTSRPPAETLVKVCETLRSLGIETAAEGHCKLKCTRRQTRGRGAKHHATRSDRPIQTPPMLALVDEAAGQKRSSRPKKSQESEMSTWTSRQQSQRSLASLFPTPATTESNELSCTPASSIRLQSESSVAQSFRSSASNSAMVMPSVPRKRMEPIYGDPAIDRGDEIRFVVEICRFRNLPGLYIVDIRRLRGSLWAYKFLYDKLLDLLDLTRQDEYLHMHPTALPQRIQP